MRSPTQRPLTADELDAVATTVVGRRLADATLLEGGTWSTAYRLAFDDGQRAVLKVGPPVGVDRLTYEQDLAAAEAHFFERACTVPGIPTPRVLGTDLVGEVVGRELLVIEHLEGTPLSEIASSLPGDVQDRIRRELGAILARLHTVTGDRFGYVRSERRSDGRSWGTTFLSMVDDLVADSHRIPTARPTRAEEIAAAIERHADDLDAVTVPVLVHFDVWDGNVLVDPGRAAITGIIDGERAFYGDPLTEFASLALMGDGTVHEPALAGYLAEQGRTSFGPPDAVERRLAFGRLYLHLLMLIEPVTRGYPVDDPPPYLERVHDWVDRDLELLARHAGG